MIRGKQMYQYKLDDYFFPEITVKANPKYVPESTGETTSAQIYIQSAYGDRDTEDRNSVRVILTVKVENDGESEAPYNIKIVGVGDFSLRYVKDDNKKVGEEEKNNLRKKTEKQIHYKGMSILHGAARDIIMTLTSRGPWDPVLLPLHHFNNKTNKK